MRAQPRLKTSSATSQVRFSWRPHAPEAFRRPIAVMESDHAYQLVICDVLDRLVRNPRHGAGAGEIAGIHDYLCHHLPLHVADEEEDLFPLMRRHAAADDGLEEILSQLHREHGADRRLNDDLCRGIGCLIGGQAFPNLANFMMVAFAFSETQRRHLAWENTVVIARARKYLSESDKAELGARMAERRGIEPPA